MLAQYILARRNGFRTVRVEGVEQSVHVSLQSQKILRAIVPGSVFHVHTGDATREKTYKNL
jgi:hypothetical protein